MNSFAQATLQNPGTFALGDVAVMGAIGDGAAPVDDEEKVPAVEEKTGGEKDVIGLGNSVAPKVQEAVIYTLNQRKLLFFH